MADMKYVVIRNERDDLKREFPFIFPNDIIHDEFAEHIMQMLRRSGIRRGTLKPVSAGFVNTMLGIKCYGKSETLNLESRGEQDNQLISTMNYVHGLVE